MLHGVLMVAAVSLNVAAAPPVKKAPTRIGEIYIIGNKVTPRSIIAGRLPLWPGEVLSDTDLAAAKQGLLWLRLLGIRSTVSVIDDFEGRSEVKGILVKVRETPLTAMLLGPPVAAGERLRKTLALIEEYVLAYFLSGSLRGGPFREVPFFDPSIRPPER